MLPRCFAEHRVEQTDKISRVLPSTSAFLLLHVRIYACKNARFASIDIAEPVLPLLIAYIYGVRECVNSLAASQCSRDTAVSLQATLKRADLDVGQDPHGGGSDSLTISSH